MEENKIDFTATTEVEKYYPEVQEIIAVIYSVVNSTPGERKIKPIRNVNDWSFVGEYLSFDKEISAKQFDRVNKKIGIMSFGPVVVVAKRLRETREELAKKSKGVSNV